MCLYFSSFALAIFFLCFVQQSLLLSFVPETPRDDIRKDKRTKTLLVTSQKILCSLLFAVVLQVVIAAVIVVAMPFCSLYGRLHLFDFDVHEIPIYIFFFLFVWFENLIRKHRLLPDSSRKFNISFKCPYFYNTYVRK